MNKTIKIILFVLLVLSIAIPTTFMAFAEKPVTVGKDIIITERVIKINPDLEKMRDLISNLDNSKLNDNERNIFEQEIKALRLQAIADGKVNPETAKMVKDAQLSLRSIFKSNEPFGVGNIKDVIVGYGVAGDKFIVHINPKYFEPKYIDIIVKKVRSIVGDKIDIEFSMSERIIPTSCWFQTWHCNPIQGGVQITSNIARCSVGFQAKYGAIEGFITAGHCTEYSGSGVNYIYQPAKTPFFKDMAGVVLHTSWYDGTTCDCAFVGMDESIEYDSVSNKIYPNIQPSGIGNVLYNDFVTTKGRTSGSYTGQIIVTSYDFTIWGGYDIYDTFMVNKAGASGDSGGPTYQSGTSSPKLLGFLLGVDIKEDVSVYSKASNVEAEMPGVILDFS